MCGELTKKLHIKFGKDIFISFEIYALFFHVSSDGRSDGRTELLSHRGAPLLKIHRYSKK